MRLAPPARRASAAARASTPNRYAPVFDVATAAAALTCFTPRPAARHRAGHFRLRRRYARRCGFGAALDAASSAGGYRRRRRVRPAPLGIDEVTLIRRGLGNSRGDGRHFSSPVRHASAHLPISFVVFHYRFSLAARARFPFCCLLYAARDKRAPGRHASMMRR